MNSTTDRDSLSSAIANTSIGKDKGLARLGDSITNLVLSFAFSLVLKRPEGLRASDRVLSQALIEAGLRYLAPRRSGADLLGDIAESLIAFAWLKRLIDIEDAAQMVASELVEEDLRDRKRGDLSVIRGFRKLLGSITERLNVQPVPSGHRLD